MAKRVTISKRPKSIKIEGLKISKADCFINSYRVATQNSDVQLIEGILIEVDVNRRAKPMPHVWNKVGNVHFDITDEQVWQGHPENTAAELRYLEVLSYPHTRYQNGDLFKFSDETNAEVASFQDALNDLEKRQADGE